MSSKLCFGDRGEAFVVALVISKAFDRIWHKGLLHKSYGITGPYHAIISDFLTNHQIKGVFDGCAWWLTLLDTIEQLVLPVCFTDMSLDAAPQVFPSLFRLLRSQCVKHVNRHQPIVTPYAVHSGVLPPTRVPFSHVQHQCRTLSRIHAFLQCIASRHSRAMWMFILEWSNLSVGWELSSKYWRKSIRWQQISTFESIFILFFSFQITWIQITWIPFPSCLGLFNPL